MRDAFNLAWKLAWIVQGRLKPEMLQSYHDERHTHAQAMIDLADKFGAVLSVRNRMLAWVRDRFFLAIRGIPSVRDYVLQMKFKPMPRFSEGVVLNSGDKARDDVIGRMFIQPNVEVVNGETRKLDDQVGPRFALISWRCDPLKNAPPELLKTLERLGCDRYVTVRSRSSEAEVGLTPEQRTKVTVIQDVDNELQPWFVGKRVDWVLIRPDRFVAAVGRGADAVTQMTRFCDCFVPAGAGTAEQVLPRANGKVMVG
jgi:3-(3-hydroxy-phenyl)propionate hydroxylase